MAFDLEWSGPGCEFDGVAIGEDGEHLDAFDWSESSHVMKRYCGRRKFLKPLVSSGNKVCLLNVLLYKVFNRSEVLLKCISLSEFMFVTITNSFLLMFKLSYSETKTIIKTNDWID